jgi:magnesium chelatase family protein
MLAKAYSNAVAGIEGYSVEVEIDLAQGLPAFNIVGLPDVAVKEAKERVRAAIKNSDWQFPVKRITVNLAPANIKKKGATFDLPIAIGILAAVGVVNDPKLEQYTLVGELSLDGTVKQITGALSMALAAKADGKAGIILPQENASEAAIIDGLEIIAVADLAEVIDFFNNQHSEIREVEQSSAITDEYKIDYQDVKGQEHAKRALEVAAAGRHNLVMIGPPGAGKTMLAKRVPTILPPLTKEEAIEVTKIFSIIDKLPAGKSLIENRPFRSPHHTISNAGLIGGGRIPQPGEISLAHQGVLFLDELTEFQRKVLEILRQPLEERKITLNRSAITLTYPCEFLLVAALNPCPCGYYGTSGQKCSCTPYQRKNYLNKISGPILDRIDIHLEIPRLQAEELTNYQRGESSAEIKKRVIAARELQLQRFKGENINYNSGMDSAVLEEFCKLTLEASDMLEGAIANLNLSARAYDRILKLSRTIADLAKSETITVDHLAEAIQYRSLDRRL